jgi:hypothetical protein
MSGFLIWALPVLAGGFVIAQLYQANIRFKRAQFVRDYSWPRGLLEKLEKGALPLARKDSALVGNGLRQFFLAYLNSGKRYVAMPSVIADELWHEFILYTRDYKTFCDQAFGAFLHHTPAEVLSPSKKASNEGLRRVWWQVCKIEAIDPKKPSRLPLLFALDTKLKVPGGYVYHPDCTALREGGASGGQCGGDFSSSSVDGGTSGFGDGHGSGDGGGVDGGGCGGGCGGGERRAFTRLLRQLTCALVRGIKHANDRRSRPMVFYARRAGGRAV